MTAVLSQIIVSLCLCTLGNFQKPCVSPEFHWKSGRLEWNIKEARRFRKPFISKDPNAIRCFGLTRQMTHCRFTLKIPNFCLFAYGDLSRAVNFFCILIFQWNSKEVQRFQKLYREHSGDETVFSLNTATQASGLRLLLREKE